MSKLTNKYRLASFGPGDFRIAHWCPGCEEFHCLPLGAGWTITGFPDRLTATPSFLHKSGKVCHYILTNGVLNFCGDCWHAMKGQAVPMPDWPGPPHEDWDWFLIGGKG